MVSSPWGEPFLILHRCYAPRPRGMVDSAQFVGSFVATAIGQAFGVRTALIVAQLSTALYLVSEIGLRHTVASAGETSRIVVDGARGLRYLVLSLASGGFAGSRVPVFSCCGSASCEP